MPNERWTILFLRDQSGPVRQYSVSARTARIALAALAVILTAGLTAGLALGTGGVARIQAQRLRAENELLSSTLQDLRGRVAGLEVNMDSLSSSDARLRVVAGLDQIDDDVLEVGIGGPGLSTPESHPLSGVDPRLGEAAFAVTYDLNVLERRARLLLESFHDADASLAKNYDLLKSTPSILPTEGFLTSGFSRARLHPIHDVPLPHEGIDLSAPTGSPIHAAAKGRVVEAGVFAGYGQMVEIDHGFGFTTRYGHASRLLVRVGQEVERGQLIALVGSTGLATGPHLHYEVRVNGKPQNPLNYVINGASP
jgi:murein DD-endopeptidase MepM/ murein hydrolase activator NlpD